MKIVTLDFETYYDLKDYSLSKMTTEEYVNDPRFEVIGVSAKIDDGPVSWRTGDFAYLKDQMGGKDWWRDVGLVCHNTRFDGAILAWKFGIVPKMYFDTLSMARPKHSANAGGSLKKLAVAYNLGEKGTEVVSASGKRREDFSPQELAQYGEYCKNDVALTYQLFKALYRGYPKDELRLIDRTIRMYTTPQLRLDPALIEQEIDNERERKARLMAQLDGIEQGDLRSNAKFADVLRSLGVAPPMKRSEKKSIKAGTDVFDYAFAKGDADFIALLEHEDPAVATAVEVRLGVKSTQKETRAARFKSIHARMQGALPVALDYCGAHTHRYAASESINLQNLPRVGRKDPNSGLLRRAIMAPEGKVLVVCDLSQIEARILVWQAQQLDKIEAFAQKRDVYSEQASVIYGRTVDRKKNPDDFTAGFIGKAVVLGCGYGLGAPKFCNMIYVGMLGEKGILFDAQYVKSIGVDVGRFITGLQQRPARMEMYMSRKPAVLGDEDWLQHCAVGTQIIKVYRASNPKVVEYWDIANNALGAMLEGVEFEFGGPTGALLRTVREGSTPAILKPNGMLLRYEGLERDRDGNYSFLRRKEGKVQRVKTYGGALVENLTQSLARDVVMHAAILAGKRGYPMALQVHDELVCVAPEDEGAEAYAAVLDCMKTPPAWGLDIPLDAEGGFGTRYGDIK